MKFQFKSDLINTISADIVLIGINDKNQILLKKGLDRILVNYIKNILKAGDLPKKTGETLMLHAISNYSKVILIRISNQQQLIPKVFLKGIINITKKLKNSSFICPSLFIKTFSFNKGP